MTRACDVCEVFRLTKGKSTGLFKYACPCGVSHHVCWSCVQQFKFDPGEPRLPTCPLTDEFKVAAAVMLEDLPPPPPASPETLKRLAQRREAIVIRAALKARREGE